MYILTKANLISIRSTPKFNISKISYTEEHTGTLPEAKTYGIIPLLMSYVSQRDFQITYNPDPKFSKHFLKEETGASKISMECQEFDEAQAGLTLDPFLSG